jgi:tetratricopeptide (TPR) repeat protein
LEDYNRVAQYSPDNVLVYYNRAGLYSQIGDVKSAIDDYTHAIKLYPDFANAYLNRSYLRAMMGDPKGARQDRQTAEKKIAEYKTRLSDSTYSIYADTTQKFDKLLSFDAKLTGSSFDNATASSSTPQDVNMRLIPLFKFTLMNPDSAMLARSAVYHAQRLEDFKKMVNNPRLMLSYEQSNIAPDSLVMMDRQWVEVMRREEPTWIMLFERGVTQSLIKQYTNAVSTLTSAIAANPSNPFLYINRSTTRAEMIDFISSIDNSYQRITIDTDPANRLLNRGSRTYNYDDAIEDINKAIKLYPNFAYSYYNRANLHAISNRLPDAYDDYTKAIELNPNFGEAYYNRGLVQIFMKDTRKGCLDLSKAGELGVKNAYEALKYYTAANE